MSSVAVLESKSVPVEVGRILYDATAIRARVGQLACEINRDFRDRELVVVGVLKGASLFTCDLIRQLTMPVRLDFLAISNYHCSPRSAGVRILKDLGEPIEGQDVLLVEDIVDTGLTLDYLVRLVRERQPRSVAVCTLLDRPNLRLADLPIRYTGFVVDQEFFIGYGLDYLERYRDLPFIATLELEGEPKVVRSSRQNDKTNHQPGRSHRKQEQPDEDAKPEPVAIY